MHEKGSSTTSRSLRFQKELGTPPATWPTTLVVEVLSDYHLLLEKNDSFSAGALERLGEVIKHLETGKEDMEQRAPGPENSVSQADTLSPKNGRVQQHPVGAPL
mmetsp:Transcript_33126/g.93773  ORF Transcript_33126/g.93773 Transcript_33126/m.93773 type:complete len:104 (+) Transcript_33126:1380-1691(+)